MGDGVVCSRVQVDESRVKQHHTFNPSTQSVEDYRYPCPGERAAGSLYMSRLGNVSS